MRLAINASKREAIWIKVNFLWINFPYLLNSNNFPRFLTTSSADPYSTLC